jgi:hypothetical protein
LVQQQKNKIKMKKLSLFIITTTSVVLSSGIVPVTIANRSNIQQANANHTKKSWIEEPLYIWVNDRKPPFPGSSGSYDKIIHTFPREDIRSWEETKADCFSRGGDDIKWIGDHKACVKTIRY